MICSLNELHAAAYKAARGGGLPWGLAEEAGRAAAWLAARGLPVRFAGGFVRRERFVLPEEKLLADKILTPSAPDKMLCPFLCGAYISDCGGRRWRLRRTARPLAVLPFAARAAGGECVAVSWAGAEIITDGDNVLIEKPEGLLSRCADIDIAPRASAVFLPPPEAAAYKMEAAEWRKLQALAARTLMPSDETSRAQDAGGAD